MLGTSVMQKSPVLFIIRTNQLQSIGAKEVVPEEAFIKDTVDEADASTIQNTHHISGTSR